MELTDTNWHMDIWHNAQCTCTHKQCNASNRLSHGNHVFSNTSCISLWHFFMLILSIERKVNWPKAHIRRFWADYCVLLVDLVYKWKNTKLCRNKTKVICANSKFELRNVHPWKIFTCENIHTWKIFTP